MATEIPALPRTVLVADDDLYLQLENDPRSVPLLEDLDAMIVPYRQAAGVNSRQVSAIRDVLLASGQLTRDALLVRSPYEASSYEPAESAPEVFASTKYHAVAVVAGLLGATTMQIVEATVDRTTGRWGSDLSLKLPLFGGGAKASREVTKRLEKRLEAKTTYVGSDPDPDAALAYLSTRNLLTDPQLRGLVELRSGKNLAAKYTLTFNGTRESATNLKAALDLASSVPLKRANVGATFTRTFESISTIAITTEITF